MLFPSSPQHLRLFAAFFLALFCIGIVVEWESSYLRSRYFSVAYSKTSSASPDLAFSFDNPSSTPDSESDIDNGTVSTEDFWASFAPILAAAAPRCAVPELRAKATATYIAGARNRRRGNLQDLAIMAEREVASMKRSHAWFLSQIEITYIPLPFQPGTHGIVTSAGGEYFPVLLVSLRMLRRTGCTLPVEVFLATEDEWEDLMCDTILPALNARCVVMSRVTDAGPLPFAFSKYQLKIFAILFSSYENVLFLDADNFPATDPSFLFSARVYTEGGGLVLWPDYWGQTPSPHFFEVSGLKKEDLQRRPTVEAGQVLVDKTRQGAMLLMSAYYNAYGEWYYHLLSQGGPGEGDKDTFAAAALVVSSPFYTVRQRPVPLGVRNEGAAVLQADPEVDFANAQSHTADGEGEYRALFIHASWPPKLNALHNYRTSRQWGNADEAKKLLGEDVEAVAWGEMVKMACDAETQFRSWGLGQKERTVVCQQTKGSFRAMFRKEWKEGGADDGEVEVEEESSG